MSPRRAALVLPLLAVTGATGCSALGGSVPDADEVLAAVDDIEGSYADDLELLVPATLGRGVRTLPPFVAGDGYSVVVRCLTPGLIEATVEDPQADADGLREDLGGDITFDRECENGMWSAGRSSTGGTVQVTITAPAETYWVAGVTEGGGLVDADGNSVPGTADPGPTTASPTPAPPSTSEEATAPR